MIKNLEPVKSGITQQNLVLTNKNNDNKSNPPWILSL